MTNQAAQTMPAMTPKRCSFFLRRFKNDEKMLGPNEQLALDYAIAALSQTAGVAEDHVAIPRHYAENVGYAAAMLENSASVIDRHNAPALRNLMSLMLAAAPAASGGEDGE